MRVSQRDLEEKEELLTTMNKNSMQRVVRRCFLWTFKEIYQIKLLWKLVPG